MAEELQESEVIFSDHDRRNSLHDDGDDDGFFDYSSRPSSRGNKIGKVKNSSDNNNKKKKMARSLPVDIPEGIFRFVESEDDQLEEEWDDEEIVPPHIIIGRRIAGKMAFSVCTGNGRTLKGRDLSQVRNSILRMTGFLEA